jgi:hypothetical protein
MTTGMPSAKFALTLPWFVGLSYWRQLTFREGREHAVVVSPGPDGRPGERLLAPSRALHRPKVVGGSRNDFSLMLDGRGNALTGVCLGRVEARGEPERSARETIDHFWRRGWAELNPLAVESIGGEPAFRYTALLPRTRFTEWKFQRAGWLYAVGAFNRRRDSGTEARAREVLDSWEWLDPS